MNLETTLTDELRVVASSVQAPPPPAVAALVREAEQERTRTRLRRAGVLGLVAAAVVGAVLLGSHVGRPSSAPEPVEPSPSYYAPGVPYVQNGTLYIDHKAQPGSWREAQTAGNHTAAVRNDQSAVLLSGSVEVEAIDGPVFALVLSPDGSKAAWIVSSGAGAGALVVRDLVRSEDLGRLPLDLRSKSGEGLGVSVELTDTGSVVYDLNDHSWSWTPGGIPQKSDGPSGDVVNPDGFSDIDTWVRLSPDHLWAAWLTDRGGHVVDAIDGIDPVQDGVTVAMAGKPDRHDTIALPPGTKAILISWNSPTEILVQAAADEGNATTIYACDVIKRTCRRIPDAGGR